jgi:pimeloyl-ACP methyl ester carboxylesterase
VADALVDVDTGVRLHYRRTGSGEPLLLAMGTAWCLGMWAPAEPALAERHDVISESGPRSVRDVGGVATGSPPRS